MSDYIKIKIRRGPNPPEINQLDFYELGYSLSTKELYIKAPKGGIDGNEGEIINLTKAGGVDFIAESPIVYDSETKKLGLSMASAVTSDSDLPVSASVVYSAIQSGQILPNNFVINCGGAMSDE